MLAQLWKVIRAAGVSSLVMTISRSTAEIRCSRYKENVLLHVCDWPVQGLAKWHLTMLKKVEPDQTFVLQHTTLCWRSPRGAVPSLWPFRWVWRAQLSWPTSPTSSCCFSSLLVASEGNKWVVYDFAVLFTHIKSKCQIATSCCSLQSSDRGQTHQQGQPFVSTLRSSFLCPGNV